MKEKIIKIWPEIDWIKDAELKEKVTNCWVHAIENSVLEAEDLEVIPFSLLIQNCNITFMNHKRTAVQLSVDIAKRMQDNFGDEIKINMDYLIAGAILIDVGKLLEYEIIDGKLSTSNFGKYVRHPFSGVGIAQQFGLPPEVLHMIGTHSIEGNVGKRSVESLIIHHADFVSFEPFQEAKTLKWNGRRKMWISRKLLVQFIFNLIPIYKLIRRSIMLNLNHKNLEVWKVSIQLVKETYVVTQLFPNNELYGLVSQMRRAAVSITSNI